MTERIREIGITVYIDTNKRTISTRFTSVDEARDYLEALANGEILSPSQRDDELFEMLYMAEKTDFGKQS